jgi:hypothetical protein
MIRDHVLTVLAGALDHPDGSSIEPALRRIDPLLRGVVRRRIALAQAAAERLAPEGPEPHRDRLAFLLAQAGAPTSSPDDVAAIEAETRAAREGFRPARTRWWLTFVVLAAVTAASLSVIFLRGRNARFDATSAPLGQALAVDVPELLVLLDRTAVMPQSVAPGAVDAVKARAMGRVKKAAGGDAAEALSRLMDASCALSSAGLDATSEMKNDLFGAVQRLDATLERSAAPYYVDATFLSASPPPRLQPVVFSFYVEKDRVSQANGTDIRSLHVWRLDRLNFTQSYLGYTRPNAPVALVLLDQIEEELVGYLLPALPEGEGLVLGDENALDDEAPWQTSLYGRAAAVARRELFATTGADRDKVAEIGRLLARRRALVKKWRASVAGLGMRLRIPQRLIPEADYAKELDVRVPRAELYEWDELHEKLMQKDLQNAFLRLRDRYAGSVERHEVQHRIDGTLGLVPVPAPLAKTLGMDNPLDAPEGSLAARSREELSAYLAQLAEGEGSAALDLVLLSRFLFAPHGAPLAYAYAALLTLTEISRELGIPFDAPITSRGTVVRENAATRLLAVLDRPPSEIRAAAGKTWERLYERKLLDVEPKSERSYPAWRH